MGGQRRMVKAMLKRRRSGYNWSTDRRTEMNEEGFVIRGKEYTEILQECL
jgi:hypothetical protein